MIGFNEPSNGHQYKPTLFVNSIVSYFDGSTVFIIVKKSTYFLLNSNTLFPVVINITGCSFH